MTIRNMLAALAVIAAAQTPAIAVAQDGDQDGDQDQAQDEAQDSGAEVETDWFVYVAEDESECVALSTASTARYFRDGSEVTANTDEPYLTVVWRPAEGAMGQVTYQGGFPFDSERPIDVRLAGESFELQPQDIWAWPANAELDAALVAAMEGADTVELSSFSGRGTNVVHTFSLAGFGPAIEEAASRCGG